MNRHFKKFTEHQFFENIKEFKGYITHHGSGARLNPDKLLNLLTVYFRSVLLYPSPDTSRYIVKDPQGGIFQIEFPGSTKEGQQRSVSLGEMSNTLLDQVCGDLSRSGNTLHQMELLKIFTSAIETPDLDPHHKVNIINAENNVLGERFFTTIREFSEKDANHILETREHLILDEVRPALKTQKPEDEHSNIQSINNILIRYVRARVEMLIYQNKFVDIFVLLYRLIGEECESETGFNQGVIGALLQYLVIYNNLFLVEPIENVRDRVNECQSIVDEDHYTVLNEMVNFSPEHIELKNLSIELTDEDDQGFKFDSLDLLTSISFVINHKPSETYKRFEYPGECSIEFIELRNLFDDPVFYLLNSLQQNINGMPTSIFSDAVGNVANSSIITITLYEFFHPDFELVENRISYFDFQEKEALLGRKYYPHKDRIIEILRRWYLEHNDEFQMNFSREEININFISNYLVNYRDSYGDSVFHKVHTITNLDSYLHVKERYLEAIARLNLSDEFSIIRKLLLETKIVSANIFQDFIARILDITVKKQIELGGINRYLWKDQKFSQPGDETDIQPLIQSHIRPILEVKGIQVSREVVAANGSIDFLCSYTYEGRLFKVGVELKKAHHQNLERGLTQQLPEYSKDQGTRHGIFLVLWYKNEKYPEPVKYGSIDQMTSSLEKSVPAKYKFSIMAIDCTKAKPPSKL